MQIIPSKILTTLLPFRTLIFSIVVATLKTLKDLFIYYVNCLFLTPPSSALLDCEFEGGIFVQSTNISQHITDTQ